MGAETIMLECRLNNARMARLREVGADRGIAWLDGLIETFQ